MGKEWIFVVDGHNHRVNKFKRSNGEAIDSFGDFGSDDGDFKLPWDIYLDHKKGYLFVTDSGNKRVQV